jgi:hypothetical protein
MLDGQAVFFADQDLGQDNAMQGGAGSELEMPLAEAELKYMHFLKEC